jgi:hypothetical protein
MEAVKNQTVADEWVSFPGGELEGKRPTELCPGCRERLKRGGAGSPNAGRLRTLCFQCYRAELDRDRRLLAAADLDTTTVERFQTTLPFEPVNKPRLAMLKVERATARDAMRRGAGQFGDERRQAQIAARHALQLIFAGVRARRAAQAQGGQVLQGHGDAGSEGQRIVSAIHAAELQLPESWLPFVVSR